MAESIRLVPAPKHLDSESYDRLIERLTNFTLLVAGVMALVLAFTIVFPAPSSPEIAQMKVRENVPYIPPKPSFK